MTREATDKICVGSVFPICSFEHMWFMTVHIIIITNTQVASGRCYIDYFQFQYNTQ